MPPALILKLVLILVGAVFIRAALFVMIGSIAFWTKKMPPFITLRW